MLFEYAKAAGICMDALVDDEQKLPDKLPSIQKHEGIKLAASARRRKR